ncbi:MAG: hypothetical protein AB7F28_00020 [Candidatus Margulisiibacteriota bacterium]
MHHKHVALLPPSEPDLAVPQTTAEKVMALLDFECKVFRDLGLYFESHYFPDLPFKLAARLVQLFTPETFQATWTALITDQHPGDPRPVFKLYAMAYLTLIEQTKPAPGFQKIKAELESFERVIKEALGLRTDKDRTRLEKELETQFSWEHLKGQVSVRKTDPAMALALKGQEVHAQAPDAMHRAGVITDSLWCHLMLTHPKRAGALEPVFTRDTPPTSLEWHQAQLHMASTLDYFPISTHKPLTVADIQKFGKALQGIRKASQETVQVLGVVFSAMMDALVQKFDQRAIEAVRAFWRDVPKDWITVNVQNACLMVLDFQQSVGPAQDEGVAYGEEALQIGKDFVDTPLVQDRLKRNFLAAINQPELPRDPVLKFFLAHATEPLKAIMLEKLFEKIKAKSLPEKAVERQLHWFRQNPWLFPKDNQQSFRCFQIFAQTFIEARKALYAAVEKTNGQPDLDPTFCKFINIQRNLPLVRAVLFELVKIDHPYVVKDLMEFLVGASQFGLSQENFDTLYEAMINHFSEALKQLHTYNMTVTVLSRIRPIHVQLSASAGPLRLGFDLINLFFTATLLRNSQLDDPLARLAYFSVSEDVSGHAVRLLDTLDDDGLVQYRQFVVTGLHAGQQAQWLSSTMYLTDTEIRSHLRLYTNMLRILLHYLFRACIDQDDALVVMQSILELALSIQSFSKMVYKENHSEHLQALYGELSQVIANRQPHTQKCTLFQFEPVLQRIFRGEITATSFNANDLVGSQLAASSASAS